MFRLRISHVALAVACAITSLPGFAAAQDAKTVLGDASKAMGVDALNTVEYSATGFDFVLRPGLQPECPLAEVHQQELLAGHRLPDSGVEGRPHPPAGREPAAWRRPAAGHR